ncbi:MAG TPA: TonB family protein [Pyrinomonadaceae bacterium]|jgi:periplasmic protein TonB|nr:TonB family protein [Pyrinomonadaceae bacterium]
MLDQLVESKSHSIENTRRNELLLGVMALAIALVAFSVYRSLTNLYNNLDLGSGDLELSMLVAPVPVPEEEPPPKPEEKPKQQVEADVRKELIQNIMSTPVKPPDTTSVVQNKVKEMRTDRLTVLGASDADTGAQVGRNMAGVTNNAGSSSGESTEPVKKDEGDAPPPPPPAKKAPPKTISGGVLNGKAVSLPKPAYPPAARAVRAAGAVQVQVLIDEEGRVVSATPAGGNPLLVPAAVAAARQARFSPTLLSGQPVKVSGIITYNFVP